MTMNISQICDTRLVKRKRFFFFSKLVMSITFAETCTISGPASPPICGYCALARHSAPPSPPVFTVQLGRRPDYDREPEIGPAATSQNQQTSRRTVENFPI